MADIHSSFHSILPPPSSLTNFFKALVATQERLQKEIDGFQFNLGFSGGFYLYGNEEEDAGDRKLIGECTNIEFFVCLL